MAGQGDLALIVVLRARKIRVPAADAEDAVGFALEGGAVLGERGADGGVVDLGIVPLGDRGPRAVQFSKL